MAAFTFTIATPDTTLFHGAVLSVNCPGSEGELTILAHHTPFVTTLKAGEIRVKTEHETRTFPIERGILEVSKNEAVILL